MKTLFQSLRWRLQAWHGLLLLLVVTASVGPAYHFALENQNQRIDRELSRLERTLIRSLMDAVQGIPVDTVNSAAKLDRPFLSFAEFVQKLTTKPVKLPDVMASQFHGKEPGYAYFSIRDKDGKIILQSDNAPSDMRFLPIPENDVVEEARGVDSRRENLRSTVHGLKIVVGRDITPELHEMQGMAWLHLAVGLGVWLFGLIGGWWLSGRAIRPIESISKTASRIAEGNLEERIDITETASELGQLSQVLNRTFERLHAAFERQRQFTADASHELRTPITILLSETQRILKRERTPEEYRDALQTCGETAQRMRRLVEALLLLARQENHETQARYQSCDLAVILQEVIGHLQPLAQERGLRLESRLSPTPCKCDAESISILLSNLVTNALQYGGHVTVECSSQNQQAVFTVRDDGPGIAAADLPHIFERFYRADQARTGSSGHTGLGLAIAKAIVENHGGSIQVTSSPGQGACFEVSLP
ncbi:heavy metal sensor kinase [Prosthecobacter fusiformis]|uniref:histidine kinase n=1 Tax=Prosthecobacter fusiformis TaxID=48464 RepID=A0A4R7SQ77_9BACT|nr:ATP-binding protein [Prosthecobacter fusiformis]TDU81104.1 heavy metal sensor kinase [Prosthecobacter fusiformis]